MSIDLADTFMRIFGMERVATVMRHPVGEPIPKGWVLVSDMKDNHHGEYAVLIKKV